MRHCRLEKVRSKIKPNREMRPFKELAFALGLVCLVLVVPARGASSTRDQHSDKTSHELDKMRNKVLAEPSLSPEAADATPFRDETTREALVVGHELSNSKEEPDAYRDEEGYVRLSQRQKQKPKAVSAGATVRRKRAADDSHHEPHAEAQAGNNITTTSDEHAEPQTVTRLDMLNQHFTLDYITLGPIENAAGPNVTGHEGQEGGGHLPDEVFSDLRDTNCFLLPRRQNICYSCYAFAAISLMEYQYCMKTGKREAFSEQYVIDCGKAYFGDHIMGCEGGYTNYVPYFFQNFGLELRSHYPYRQSEDPCPYPADAEPETVGYLRPDLKNVVEIHTSRWPEVLKHQPLMVGVLVDSGNVPLFQAYRGGIFARDCPDDQDDVGHPMLVVGHGREDGQEYWLVRNCFGFDWGHAGHMKLAKEPNCIKYETGVTFATITGREMLMEVEKNERYDASKVASHYFERIHEKPFTSERLHDYLCLM